MFSYEQGIQYLTALESLNLYYNSISSLSEVFRLHCLTELRDVDFRLNPVVKSESDYRLFVVHMLPRLQQLGRARVSGFCAVGSCLGGQGLWGLARVLMCRHGLQECRACRWMCVPG